MSEVVMLQNIIRGQLLEPTERKIVGRFSFPVTTAQDVASAMKFARFQQAEPLDKVLRVLSKIGRDASWIGDEDLKVQAELSGSPIKHMRNSIQAVNHWLANIEEYVKRNGTLKEIGDADQRKTVLLDRNGMLCQGGLTTMFILAGDEISIAPWNIAQALLAGTKAVVKPSRIEPLSAFLFTKALIAEGVQPPALLYISRDSDEEQCFVGTLIKQTQQSVMYGEDNTVNTICQPFGFRAEHKYLAYLTGRSGAVVYPDADVNLAAEMIIRGACDDRGNRCNSTKKVFVARQLAKDMELAMVREADKLVRGEPTDEATDIGRNDPQARVFAQQWASSAQVFYDKDMFLMSVPQTAPVLKEELPYPSVAVCYYDEGQDPVELMNNSVSNTYLGAAVAVSVFTRSLDQFNLASSRMHCCKTLLNLPSTAYDFWTAHQRWHLFTELMRKVEIVVAT
ncbi:hypothetical protein SFSGTM_11840 [Sulfuriferula nivalis]|uniref:Aldehyde dehydrogenase domain-containing protein n=2 Tax=Sulfuriferula nivalis TaxID=2675298 RepID=A0A809RFQ5_9PROT|nr:hypothetical protein SFSGTM_11840 [Sulfuriferula nivalis]